LGIKIRKSLLIQIIVFLIVTGITAFLFVPVQNTIEEKLSGLRVDAIAYLENVLGRTISYDEVSPSFFRSIKIRGLTVYGSERPETPLLKIRQVRIYYRLFPLLLGDPIDAVYQIRIENSEIEINEENDADIIKLVRDFIANREELIIPNLVFVGKNLRFSYTQGDFSAEAGRVFTRLTRGGPGSFQVQLRGEISTRFPEPFGQITGLDTKLQIFGTVPENFSSADLRVRLKDISTNLFTLHEQNFRFSFHERELQLQKIQGREPVDISASFDLDSTRGEMTILTEDFYPSSYGTLLSGSLPKIRPWLTTRISGVIECSYSIKTGELEYSADIEAYANNEILPFPVYTEIDAAGNLDSVDIDRALVQTYRGTVVYAGSFHFSTLMPSGVCRVIDLTAAEGYPVNGTFILRPYKNVLRIQSDAVTVAEARFSNLTSFLSFRKDEYELRLQAAVGSSEGSLLSFEGNLTTGDNPFFQGAVEMEDCSAAEIASLLPLPVRKSDVEPFFIDTEIFFTTDFDQYAYVSPYFTVSSPTEEKKGVAFSVAGNSETIEITGIEGRWENIFASGTLTVDFTESGSLDFQSRMRVNGFDYAFNGILKPETGMQLEGSYNTRVLVFLQENKFVFHASTAGIPFRYNNSAGEINLELYGLYEDPDSWRAYISTLELVNGKIGEEYTFNAGMKAVVDRENLYIQHLRLEDRYSVLEGRGRALIGAIDPLDLKGWITMADSDTKEVYTLAGGVAGRTMDANISFTSSPIRRFQIEQLAGDINGSLTVSGAVSSPSFVFGFATKNATLNNDKIGISGRVISTKEYMEIPDFTLTYLSNRLTLRNCEYNHVQGDISLTGDFSGIFQGRELQSKISASGFTEKRGPRKKIGDILKGNLSGNFVLSPITYRDELLDPWEISFQKNGPFFSVRREPDNTITAKIKSDGYFEMKISEPLPFQLYAEGTVRKNRINADVKDINLDIEALNTVLNIPYFDINRGTGRGNLSISGTLTDPDFSGKLQIIDGYAENPLIPVDLGPFRADLLFSGKNFTVPLFYVQAGAAEVAAELDFIIDHWIPKYYLIEIESVGNAGVPMVTNFSRIYVDGDVLIDMVLAGDFSGIDISGELTPKNMRLTLGDAPEQEGSSNFAFNVDLTVNTGRQIEFLWPAETFPVLQTYAETDESVEIQYNSLAKSYSVTGDVSTRGGQIFYFNRNFLLKEASISFNEEQGRFDPKLTARAELREITDTGEDVTIIMIVDEKPFSQFSPRFESDPPLPGNEVLALLGQNIMTQIGGEQIDLGATLALTGNIFLKQLGIMASIENTMKEILRLDLFSIRSQMLENLLTDRFFAKNVTEERGEAATLGRYLDNTTLFLGKYLSEDIFLEAMLGLRLKQSEGEILYTNEEFVIDTEVSLEWKTPLALLEFSFMPDMTDLFGTPPAISLALSWGFSF
jgi:translocation and assembly module TamB